MLASLPGLQSMCRVVIRLRRQAVGTQGDTARIMDRGLRLECH